MRTALGAALGVALLTLTACGGSDADTSGAPASAPLTPALADQALLTASDLSGTFTASDTAADSGASQVGCLQATDALTGVAAQVHEQSAFVSATGTGASGVLSQVFSDPDPSLLSDAVGTFTRAMASCTSVQETSPDGIAVRLSIATNTNTTDAAARQQLNLDATGTLASGGTSYQYHVGFVVSLVGENSMTIVAAYDLAPKLRTATVSAVDQLPDLSRTVVDRVAGLA